MVLYAVYRAPKESKGRSLVPRRLRELGCRQVHRSFWEIKEEKASKVLKVLEKNRPILLKRVREIRKPRFMKSGGISELGSLVIVMYAAPIEVKRERIKNFLVKAPCIRLCRSVYAFSQNHSFFDKENELVDAFKFATFVKGIQGDVKVIPRVVAATAGSNERLLQEVRGQMEGKVSDIIESCKELYQKALRGDDIASIRSSLSKNKKRLLAVKKVVAFHEKWVRMDFSRSLMKSYKAFKKVSSTVNRK